MESPRRTTLLGLVSPKVLCTLSTLGETDHARTRSLGRCPMSKNPSWQSPGRFPRFLLSFPFHYGPGRRSNIRCPNEARSFLDVRGPDRGTRKRFVPVPEIDEAVSQRGDLTCRRHGCQRHAGDRRTKINEKGGGVRVMGTMCRVARSPRHHWMSFLGGTSRPSTSSGRHRVPSFCPWRRMR